MKNTIIALSLLVTSLAHAKDITLEQLNKLYQQNAEAYKTVTVGMTAEYLDYTLDGRGWCNRNRKEEVVEVTEDLEYHVRVTTTIANNGCESSEGSVFESYEWREIKEMRIEKKSHLSRFEIEGNIAESFKLAGPENGPISILREKIDVTKSQFYNRHKYNYSANGVENGSGLLFRDGKVALIL